VYVCLFCSIILADVDLQLNSLTRPTWASLARDYLPIMSTSVPSERAFSSAGVTITKRRNRLKGDVVEALQVLKGANRQNLFPEYPSLAVEDRLAREEREEDKEADEIEGEANALDLDDDCDLDDDDFDDDFEQLCLDE
jgi:hypothetical protein